MTHREQCGIPFCTEHQAWWGMWQRCNNPRHKRYKDYGGRGIKVCDRWRDFFAFIDDMGRKSSPGLSLDRIDNDGDYCPENCRWADNLVQAANTRLAYKIEIGGVTKSLSAWCRHHGIINATALRRYDECGDWEKAFELAKVNREEQRKIRVTIDGESRTLAGWAKLHGIPPKVVWQRINRDGMTPEEAITRGKVSHQDRNRRTKPVTIDGETRSQRDWCKKFNIHESTVWKRVKSGMTMEQALKTPLKK